MNKISKVCAAYVFSSVLSRNDVLFTLQLQVFNIVFSNLAFSEIENVDHFLCKRVLVNFNFEALPFSFGFRYGL